MFTKFSQVEDSVEDINVQTIGKAPKETYYNNILFVPCIYCHVG